MLATFNTGYCILIAEIVYSACSHVSRGPNPSVSIASTKSLAIAVPIRRFDIATVQVALKALETPIDHNSRVFQRLVQLLTIIAGFMVRWSGVESHRR